jgi:hypothetical protein
MMVSFFFNDIQLLRKSKGRLDDLLNIASASLAKP